MSIPKWKFFSLVLVFFAAAFGGVYAVPFALAHCDTEDGPVITEAKAALEKGDVTPLLKWVKKEHEKELGSVFKLAVAARSKGDDVRILADHYLFETLVRLHRAGEGEPYTGIKPAGSTEPIVLEADKAIEAGSLDHLAHEVTGAVHHGMEERFSRVLRLRPLRNQSVAAGREYVEAYVEFMHYVEAVHLTAGGSAIGHHGHIAPREQGH